MAIGERIRYIRNLRGMTQKYLGMLIGFNEKAADVRLAQYESGARTPKEKVLTQLADALEICPQALALPDIDSDIGLAHTLFALEDLYGFKINNIDGELCITLDKSRGMTYVSMYDIFKAWYSVATKRNNNEISQEEYDTWRYRYPEYDSSQKWAKIPSKELSDALVKRFGKVDK